MDCSVSFGQAALKILLAHHSHCYHRCKLGAYTVSQLSYRNYYLMSAYLLELGNFLHQLLKNNEQPTFYKPRKFKRRVCDCCIASWVSVKKNYFIENFAGQPRLRCWCTNGWSSAFLAMAVLYNTLYRKGPEILSSRQ